MIEQLIACSKEEATNHTAKQSWSIYLLVIPLAKKLVCCKVGWSFSSCRSKQEQEQGIRDGLPD